ncbi:hypothetical protein COO60DRAFT_1507385 [Scenedesmus sp. NREL 46B-D3]|nr:hypothetical protein COO60DRAFT_1507385 [Scenedesmus sp. NREL 46B-D3]
MMKPNSSRLVNTITYVEPRMLRKLPLPLGVAGRVPGSSCLLLLLFMLLVLRFRCGELHLADAAALPCTAAPASWWLALLLL